MKLAEISEKTYLFFMPAKNIYFCFFMKYVYLNIIQMALEENISNA